MALVIHPKRNWHKQTMTRVMYPLIGTILKIHICFTRTLHLFNPNPTRDLEAQKRKYEKENHHENRTRLRDNRVATRSKLQQEMNTHEIRTGLL
jgi:hypothetical protein